MDADRRHIAERGDGHQRALCRRAESSVGNGLRAGTQESVGRLCRPCGRACRGDRPYVLHARQRVLRHVHIRPRQHDAQSTRRDTRHTLRHRSRRPSERDLAVESGHSVRSGHILPPDRRHAELPQQRPMALCRQLLDSGAGQGRQRTRSGGGDRLGVPPRRPLRDQQRELQPRQRRHIHRTQLVEHAVESGRQSRPDPAGANGHSLRERWSADCPIRA